MAPIFAPTPRPTPSPTVSPGNPTSAPVPAPTPAPVVAPTPSPVVFAAAEIMPAASSSSSGNSDTITTTASGNIIATICVVAAVLIVGAFVAGRRSVKTPAPAREYRRVGPRRRRDRRPSSLLLLDCLMLLGRRAEAARSFNLVRCFFAHFLAWAFAIGHVTQVVASGRGFFGQKPVLRIKFGRGGPFLSAARRFIARLQKPVL